MEALKLLVVEDDVTSQMMVKSMLSDYQLTVVDSGEAAIEAAADSPDLIILDINLPGIDGYETCRRLREMEQTRKAPIVFLSSYTGLEDRLQAYGAGGNDYISKPFDPDELKTKVSIYAKSIERQQKVAAELKASHGMLMNVQTSASKIQSISRFIQATLFCTDIDMLFRHFFKTAREINIECVLRINSTSGVETRARDGEASVLEREILDMSAGADRIHSFGHGRAIFRWGNATLLVLQVGEMIDTLALFMDALEAGIKSIDSRANLLDQVSALDEYNSKIQDRVTELFGKMNLDLRDAILSLGLVSALDIEDEDRLADLIEGFSKLIKGELKALADNNMQMQGLIRDLQTPPPELLSLMEEETDGDDGLLF